MTITSSTRCSVMSSHVGLDMCGISEICGIHLIHMFCGIFRFCVVCSSNAPANYSCAPFLCLLRTLFSLSVTFPFPQSPWEYRLLSSPSFAILVGFFRGTHLLLHKIMEFVQNLGHHGLTDLNIYPTCLRKRERIVNIVKIHEPGKIKPVGM